MGTKLTIEREHVVAGKLLKPAFYKCRYDSYEEKPAGEQAKHPGSTNRFTYFIVLEGDDAGVRLQVCHAESFAPLMGPLYTACGGTFAEGVTLDLEEGVGKELLVHVIRGTYNGKPTNEVDGFKAIG